MHIVDRRLNPGAIVAFVENWRGSTASGSSIPRFIDKKFTFLEEKPHFALSFSAFGPEADMSCPLVT